MLKRTLKTDGGSAFVELALVLPLLCLILIGAAELGRMAYFAIEVSDAARAGVAYGSQSLSASAPPSFPAIVTAAQLAAADVPTLTATPSDACVCETITSSTGSVTTVSIVPPCGGNGSTAGTIQCAASIVPGVTKVIVNYIQVSTSANVSTMFHYPGIPASFTLTGFAKMRVEGGD